jgi:putative GTP pyrophosphokinase
MIDEDGSTALKRLKTEYDAIRPYAERYLEEVTRQLNYVLSAQGTPLSFPIQGRVKEWHSLVAKLASKTEPPTTVRRISDLVGVRVVVPFTQSIQQVLEVIREEFDVLRIDDKLATLGDDEFGYTGTHILALLGQGWSHLPTLSELKQMPFEIQVRTIAQHTWATVSHALFYKHERDVPPQLQRALNRVAAQLEGVDTEFERFLEEREKLAMEGTEAGERELDLGVLRVALDRLLPPVGPRHRERLGAALLELRSAGISRVSDLEHLAERSLSYAIEKDKEMSRPAPYNAGHPVDFRGETYRGGFYSREGYIRLMLEHELAGLMADTQGQR